MPKTVRIMQSLYFALDSIGNGWAYALHKFKPERRYVWLQDDDATQFRKDLDSVEKKWPHEASDFILSRLWVDFEYGQISRPDAD
ncbi:hypothetical protein [Methylocystis hirsuta]|uniref:Uncharacterized protein n=1 Tax=Methylocystis hirsuta TaxID=369798 RepID=A0A3M9XN13_9HYPH|nr:hypothetical protein [Methylocystis hirsuta]RNJ49384.1 hypothetical protein D1O30_06990 [Methylocystis hirsuta]